MKTFEERYTAWIDGQLESGALTAFEQELSRRAAVGDAEADKADAAWLRTLLQNHLQAPELTNPDFFNHQLLQRIEAESPTVRVRGDGRAKPALFAWGFFRLVAAGAFSLFAAAALYYGLMPQHPGSGLEANNSRHAPQIASVSNNAGQVAEAVMPLANEADKHAGTTDLQLAKRSPTPPSIEDAADIQATIPDQATNPTTATPLHYNKPNVNVLWLNGLEYMPSVPETSGTTVDGAGTPMAAPAASPAL